MYKNDIIHLNQFRVLLKIYSLIKKGTENWPQWCFPIRKYLVLIIIRLKNFLTCYYIFIKYEHVYNYFLRFLYFVKQINKTIVIEKCPGSH